MSGPSAEYMREWRKRNYKHCLEYEAKRRERERGGTPKRIKSDIPFAEKYAKMVKTFGGAVRPVASKASQFGVMAFAPSYGTMNGRPMYRL
jgi:hypothetical protein